MDMKPETPSSPSLWMEFLQGSVLANPKVRKNYRFALFLALLAGLSIFSSNSADRKVVQLQKLSEEHKAVNSAFVSTRSALMRQSLEQSILERVEPLGLQRPQHPPIAIPTPKP